MVKRILTGLIAAALLVALLVYRHALDGLIFQAAVFFILLVCQKEMIDALRVRGHNPRAWAVYVASALLIPAYFWRGGEGLLIAFIAGFVLMLCAAVLGKGGAGDVMATVFPLVYPAAPLVAIAVLARLPEPYDLILLVSLFLTSIASDVFALVFGLLFGRHKLIPSVSPNKTWEGAIGGFLATITAMVIFGAVYSNIGPGGLAMGIHFIAFGAVGSIATQMGDLVASSVKRYCGIKDFGNFFPGHGGALDRIDGMLMNGMVLLVYAFFAVEGALH